VDILQEIQSKMANGEYEFAIPHFFEEMTEDDLILPDIEMAIAHGHIHRHFTRDPRGTRYEIVGPATDEREIAVICRIKSTGELLLITTYALE
jgi:hypothetical protein